MCGIVGIIKQGFDPIEIESVLQTLKHRGPDGEGVFYDEFICLGHRRLSIQDLTDNASQPMSTEDGRYTIVYNGEIYNHYLIREQLVQKGIVFNSNSDTETLLKGYAIWGEQIIPKLNGIFAFALYDSYKKELLITRDRMGVKPLYYSISDDCFIFASELKSIVQLQSRRPTVNYNAIFECLLLQWNLGEHTGLNEVHKLQPGSSLFIRLSEHKIIQSKQIWHNATMNGVYTFKQESDALQELDERLNESVRAQLLSDKPIAYFLSGGIDSSLVTAIARQYNQSEQVQAFCVSAGTAFQQEGFGDDAFYAQKIAHQLNIRLELVDAKKDFLSELDQTINQLEEMQADVAAIYVGQIAQAAKNNGFNVMLAGTGADDLFSGYRRHQALYLEDMINQTPLFLRSIAQHLIGSLPLNNRTRRIKKIGYSLQLNSQERLFNYFFWANKIDVLHLFNPDYAQTIAKNHIEQYFAQYLDEIPQEKNILNQMLHLEQRGFLTAHNLNYTDKMGMAAGVEIRVPYLDNTILDFSNQLAPSLKMKGQSTKYLLKKVAEKYLPSEIIHRPKTGFGAPIRNWIIGDNLVQKQLKERLLDKSFISRGIFNQQSIEKMIDDTIGLKKDNAHTLFAIATVASWLQQFTPQD